MGIVGRIKGKVAHYQETRKAYEEEKRKAEIEYAPKRARMEVEEKFNRDKIAVRGGEKTSTVSKVGSRITTVFGGGGSFSGDTSKIFGGGSGYNSDLRMLGLGGKSKKGEPEESKNLANISAQLFGGKPTPEPSHKKPKKVVTKYF